jgi:YD repeat-containing protein
MTWQNGRQLASLTKSGVTSSYTYNSDGIRTRKTVGGVAHDYVLDGTRILADYSSGSEITFAYDENGAPQSFTYNGTKYNYNDRSAG